MKNAFTGRLMKVLFCNIGWMRNYNGIEGDSLNRGGSYNAGATGHEVCNFSKALGTVYGFVQPSGEQIKIEKLGAKKSDSSITGVTVIWTAGPDKGGTVVVGWYKEATVYRERKTNPKPTTKHKENGVSKYYVKAKAENVFLLPISARNFLIPRAQQGGGGIGQSNVWYAQHLKDRKIVAGALRLIKTGIIDELPDLDNSTSGKEGNPRLQNHLRRERNSKIVRQKKDITLKETGALRCEVCNFDFSQFYGELGKDFCEVHHLLQLSKADGEVTTKLEELAVVCSNCHRIIHKHDPMLTLNQLRKVIPQSRR